MGPPDQQATIALQRFGLGPRPGSRDAITDGRAALHAELAHADAALIYADTGEMLGLEGTAGATRSVYAASEARRTLDGAALSSAAATTAPAGRSEAAVEASQARLASLKILGNAAERLYRAEALARFRRAATAPIGFAERLVAFWSNHFCVSVAKGEIARATAGSFEREAIRPFVLGRFADMLIAVERHPAMVVFLDNATSTGPEARAGRNGAKGLNENLGREILELHTLGVDGRYSQADVTAFARVLTGWTVAGRDGRRGEPGTFAFDSAMHQPGPATVLDRGYPPGGYGQGEAVLNDLAAHPATARHLATKLVRHFIADPPPPGAVARLASVFTAHDGDLKAVSLALIDLPDAWSLPLTGLRDPFGFLIAAYRLLDLSIADPGALLGGLRTLGMPLWEPPGPNGFPDGVAAWGSPEGLKLRLDASAQLALRASMAGDPTALLDAAFGSTASVETRAAVLRAESRQQAVALLLMSPEFQRS
ncbi:DUF1800 family protein [Lichenihabitans sp. Uapishka_5]|uniref:DUF1800 domain-containing protein n=1 Tax=Lichenihabitans sp. Uapishka_5 TaxID=3037302 RepID=UPI0029E7CE37|nr:DUF1800 family protein [Lichenihabitans sp. Uapishka_5]MDX7950950.1 DUF1800 family protein [Lichenihabitans sp. Uapishka_5]